MKIRHLLSMSILSLLVSDLTAYTLSITKIGAGNGSLKINGIARSLPFSHDYAAGFHLTVEAVADDGSIFKEWSGSGLSGSKNPVSFDMPAVNIDATANFSLIPMPDIMCTKAYWDFQSVKVGNFPHMGFCIYNTGNAELNVTAVTITGADVSESSIQGGGGSFTLAPGAYRVLLDASGFAPGIYLYRIEMGQFRAMRKMVVVE
jgi:hypothetical protein